MKTLRSARVLVALALTATALVGCAADVDEEEGSTEDALSVRPQIVGALARGATETAAFTGVAKYVAFRLELTAGAEVDLQVTSETGAPSIYLLKSDFGTLARAEGISGAAGARITKSVRAAGTYYLALRESSGRAATFSARFHGPAAASCSSDAQCGGGGAVCVFDHCASVESTTRSTEALTGFAQSRITAVEIGFGAGDQLRLAYRESTLPDYPFINYGLWPDRLGYRSPGDAFSLQRTLGKDPALAYVRSVATRDETLLITERAGGAPGGIPGARRGTIAYAKDPSGSDYFAFVQTSADRRETSLYFCDRQSGGAWSAPQLAAPLSTSYLQSLVIHPRRDGGADVLVGQAGGSFRVRRSADGTWTKTYAPLDPLLEAVHAGNGRTHVLTRRLIGENTYEARYVEVGDGGIARQRHLGSVTSRGQLEPLGDVNVDAAGNVYLLKLTLDASERETHASVLRIDPQGAVLERSLADLQRIYRDEDKWSLAVSPKGEIALATTLSGSVKITRWTPRP